MALARARDRERVGRLVLEVLRVPMEEGAGARSCDGRDYTQVERVEWSVRQSAFFLQIPVKKEKGRAIRSAHISTSGGGGGSREGVHSFRAIYMV